MDQQTDIMLDLSIKYLIRGNMYKSCYAKFGVSTIPSLLTFGKNLTSTLLSKNKI